MIIECDLCNQVTGDPKMTDSGLICESCYKEEEENFEALSAMEIEKNSNVL